MGKQVKLLLCHLEVRLPSMSVHLKSSLWTQWGLVGDEQQQHLQKQLVQRLQIPVNASPEAQPRHSQEASPQSSPVNQVVTD